jgi:hypothetical protein
MADPSARRKGCSRPGPGRERRSRWTLGYDDGFRWAPAATIKAAGLAYLHVKLHFRPGDRAATEAASIAAVNPGSTAAGTGDTARTGADSTITPSRCSTPSIGNPTDAAVTAPQRTRTMIMLNDRPATPPSTSRSATRSGLAQAAALALATTTGEAGFGPEPSHRGRSSAVGRSRALRPRVTPGAPGRTCGPSPSRSR